jgi:hypothetical protein
MQRGLSQEEAVALIVNGFAREVLQNLPMEFAVEAQKLGRHFIGRECWMIKFLKIFLSCHPRRESKSLIIVRSGFCLEVGHRKIESFGFLIKNKQQ